MKNVNLKLTVWGMILLAGVIFFAQNSSPVVSLVILGTETIALPVAVWLILSVILGLVASIIIQFLFAISVRPRRRSQEWDDTEEEFDFSEKEEDRRERFTSQNRFNQEQTVAENAPESVSDQRSSRSFDDEEDWESPPRREDWNDLDDDWNIEEPPSDYRNPPRNLNQEFYEVQKQPQKTSQQGSVYSYRYREANRNSDDDEDDYDQEKEETSPGIYDANYRVIRPPLWNLSHNQETGNEEDDDDER